jgi:hypothetical protein
MLLMFLMLVGLLVLESLATPLRLMGAVGLLK